MILYDKQKCYCVTCHPLHQEVYLYRSTADLLTLYFLNILSGSITSFIYMRSDIYQRPPPPPSAIIHHHTLVPTTIFFMILHPPVTSTWFMSSVSKTTAIDPFLTISSPHFTSPHLTSPCSSFKSSSIIWWWIPSLGFVNHLLQRTKTDTHTRSPYPLKDVISSTQTGNSAKP